MKTNIQGQFTQAFSLHQKGKLESAHKIYLNILRSDPHHFDSLHLVGMIENQIGNNKNAIKYIERAILINQKIDFVFNNLGEVYLSINDFENALVNFEKCIVINNKFEKAYFNKAEVFRKLNQYKKSLLSYDKCIHLNQNNINAYLNKGVALFQIKEFENAISCFEKVILIEPFSYNAIINKGQCYIEIKDYKNAIVTYDELTDKFKKQFVGYLEKSKIFLKIDDYKNALKNIDIVIDLKHVTFEVYYIKARILTKLKLYEDAIRFFDKVISLKSDHYKAINDRGNLYFLKKDYDQAINNYKIALTIKSEFSLPYFNLGKTYLSKNNLNYALKYFKLAIKYKADHGESYNYIGIVLRELKKYSDSYIYFTKALSLEPENDTILSNLFFIKMILNNWKFKLKDKNYSISDTIMSERINIPFVSIVALDNPYLQKIIAKNYVNKNFEVSKNLNNKIAVPNNNKIKVGYFSSDFTSHPVSDLAVELFESHDRSKFEIFAFSLKSRNETDLMKKRLNLAFDKFFEIEDLKTIDIVKLSRSNKIDIAVDLNGHTKYARTDIFLNRAAPIQVNFLGYPGTMGVDCYDYIIADKIVIPLRNKDFYSEKIVYMPVSYQVNPSLREISNKIFTREELGLPKKGVIFSCFNNNYKILPSTFKIWMKILKEVKNSVIWLQVTNEVSKYNFFKEAEKFGIDKKRIIFTKFLNDKREHLARIRLADLFLDTFPYNAQATASDAIWSGLPVLTCMGKSFSSRVAASLLNAIGLDELITNNHEKYMEVAIKLGNNPKQLKRIKSKIRHNIKYTSLFDSKVFTKNIEKAYQKMILNLNSSANDIFINKLQKCN